MALKKEVFRLTLCCLGSFDPAETSRLSVLRRLIGDIL